MAEPSNQFSGDMSRNEVEIDLNKFMAVSYTDLTLPTILRV